MLKQRVLTALVLLLVLGAVIASGMSIPFVLLITLFIGVAYWEALRLIYAASSDNYFKPGIVGVSIYSICLLVYLLIPSENTTFVYLSWLLNTGIWLLMFIPMVFFSTNLKVLPKSSLGISLPIVFFANATALVAAYGRGWVFMLTLLALVWVADIGAYTTGKLFGKRKLAPHISPGKTIEGALGGLVLCVLWILASAYFIPNSFGSALMAKPWGLIGTVIATVSLTSLSIVGDLFESLLKRRSGRKDSSQLLPGHGGVYDRIDALLPVIPFAMILC